METKTTAAPGVVSAYFKAKEEWQAERSKCDDAECAYEIATQNLCDHVEAWLNTQQLTVREVLDSFNSRPRDWRSVVRREGITLP
jgi:hypothetical protein